jgi:hypothetical protein
LEAQIEQQQLKLKASLDERLSIGEQRRELEIKRVLAMLEAGVDPGTIGDFSELSVLVKEEMMQMHQARLQAQQQQLQESPNDRTQPADVPVDQGRNPNPRSKQMVPAPQRVFEAANAAGNGPTNPPNDPGGAS